MASPYEISPENCLGYAASGNSRRHLAYGMPQDVPVLGQSSNADDEHGFQSGMLSDPSLPVLRHVSPDASRNSWGYRMISGASVLNQRSATGERQAMWTVLDSLRPVLEQVSLHKS